ncbi:MAG: hypothetical protein HC811_10350 [Flammeovirgaceae bacterium]|nr:hypothetical protein [Flammeovirgaceae bacterium]
MESLSLNEWIIYAAEGLTAIGILILLYHEYKLLIIKDYKEKYDYVNLHEIRFFTYAVVSFIIAAALYSNVWVTGFFEVQGALLQGFIRIMYTAGFIVIAYISLSSIIKVMYPSVIERRLKKIRNKPRTSPDGNKMRKLSEEEEDAHLDASQIAEESSDVHSVDYDVWLDEKTGYKRIEKYMNYQHAEKCPSCSYYTMKIKNEELEIIPTSSEPGKLVKHYQCSYCRHREAREVTVASFASNVA